MAEILTRPASLIDVPNSYCPGCGHGVVHRVLAEVLDEDGRRSAGRLCSARI